MHIRTLQRKGYALKSSSVGHWVDGRCGYLATGYHESREEAVEEAARLIQAAVTTGKKPAWLLDQG